MSKKIIAIAFFAILSLGLYSQRSALELTFTAINNAAYVQLNSIKVMNRTQGRDTVLYWPDTMLTLEINPGDLMLFIGYSTGSVGVKEVYPDEKQFQLLQNYPNPVKDQSIISMYIPAKGIVNIMITDIQGRIAIANDLQLDKGNHSFRFTPGGGNLFLLTARWNGLSRSIKILTIGSNSGKKCTLDYTDSGNEEPFLEVTSTNKSVIMKESGILDVPVVSKTYTFQFATNIPCPETPIVNYGGQVYNTIQIFSQCWLKENLNLGIMIPEDQWPRNDDVIEKYCYNNEEDSCLKYGGLYTFYEMMQYVNIAGTQGICPPGWHIPTPEDWKVLEGAVDSLYGIGHPIWNWWDYRGYDAGTNLKTTSGWYEGGNGTDLYGFSGLPGGDHSLYSDEGVNYSGFSESGKGGFWWTSKRSEEQGVLARYLYFNTPWVKQTNLSTEFSRNVSVRCLRDY